jgi:F-box domain
MSALWLASTFGMSIMKSYRDLPAELHLLILAKLDFLSILRVATVNKKLRNIVKDNPNVCKPSLLDLEEEGRAGKLGCTVLSRGEDRLYA